MGAVYCDIEPYVCEWMRRLIAAGHVAAGGVLERSIVDLQPKDVRRAKQFHAFAGIGVWSHALRLAGWPDDVPVWTGSCPCTPFSAAGKREGFDDERHLWPDWFRLIRACRPPIVFAEQVSSDDGLDWLDVVLSDLEGEGYQTAAFDLCAASLGAPHIRQRLFIVALADPDSERSRSWRTRATRRWKEVESHRHGPVGWLANSESERSERFGGTRRGRRRSADDGRVGSVGHADCAGPQGQGPQGQPTDERGRSGERIPESSGGAGELVDANGLVGGQGGALARGSVEGSGALEGAGLSSAGGARRLAGGDDGGCEEFRFVDAEDRYASSGYHADGRGEVDGAARGLVHADREWLEGKSRPGSIPCTQEQGETGLDSADRTQHAGASGGVGDTGGDGDRQHARELPSDEGKYGRRTSECDHPSVFAGATRGFWAGADWVWCRDGKYRPTQRGSFPLSHGAPIVVGSDGATEEASRSGMLRAYGNAIVAQVAAAFIRVVMDEVIVREERS